MKNLTTFFSVFMSFLLLVSIAGIPVMMNHVHNPNHNIESLTQESLSCDDSNICCESDVIETEITTKKCECNLISSCCCCFIEVQLVSFTYKTPLTAPLHSPDFIIAFVTNLFEYSNSFLCSQFSTKSLELPPPKTYSQQLSFFQVFRI